MELKEGMYVRTEYGISKIVNIFFEKTGTFIETDNGLGNCSMSTRGKLHKGIYIFEEDYKTFIENNVKSAIIDLIEVGDYVNGQVVTQIVPNNRKLEPSTMIYTGTNYFVGLYNEQIETIVTKEQFESMSYKVGE